MTGKRRSFTPSQRADVVRMHLKDRVPVSQIAEQMEIYPSVINGWIRAALEQVDGAFVFKGTLD
ncbi:MAG: transposase, partial [Planctomycetota bacterium]